MISTSEILKASILIVDDNDANVSLLEQMLRGAGYVSVASTRDPREVCKLQRKNRYDLILLDLQMPGMDGFQVMEALKEIESDGYLPILVLTAHPDHKLRALKAGAKDFVSIPFDLAEVLIRVHNMLEVRLLQQKLTSTTSRGSKIPSASPPRRLGIRLLSSITWFGPRRSTGSSESRGRMPRQTPIPFSAGCNPDDLAFVHREKKTTAGVRAALTLNIASSAPAGKCVISIKFPR